MFSKKQKQFHSLRTEFFLKKNKGKDHKKKLLEQAGFLRTEKNRPLIQ